MGNFLTCETREGLMDIYISSPQTEEKLPVVLVIQEIFGVNHHIRSVCDRLAHEGYVAVAPDLFHRDGRRIEVPYGDKSTGMSFLKTLNNENVIRDIEDTLNFLPVLPTVDMGNVNVMGFCIGGFISMLTATKFPVEKVISFYGAGMVREREGINLRPILSEFDSIVGECLLFFGEQDSSIPSNDRHAIENKLKDENIFYEMIVYPNTDHGFFCDERKSYNQESASDAWKKTLKFLKDDYSFRNNTENLRTSKSMLSSGDGHSERAGDRS